MGKIASLVPPTTISNGTSIKDAVATHVNVLASIRAYAIAVEQTNLVAATNPPPDWFKTLSTNLGLAQKHSTIWTATLEPALTTVIPQAVLNISSRFKTGTDAILNILTQSNYSPNADQVKDIVSFLDWIFEHVGQEQTSITGVKGDFSTFQSNAATDLTNLTTGNNSIQQALLDDNQVVTKLQADIAIQQADIAKDNAAITAAGIAGGIGLFVGISVIGLGAASTGPAAPFAIAIGALILLGSIIEMAAVIAVYEKKLAAAQSQLNEDTTELQNEKQQIAALTIMNTSVSTLVQKNKDMANSLTDLADWFSAVTSKISTVVSDIKDAQNDMNSQDWLSFSLDIQQAQKDWNDFQSFATGWQTTVTTIQNQVINIHQVKAA